MPAVNRFRALLRVEVEHEGRHQGLLVRTTAGGMCEVHFVDVTPASYYTYHERDVFLVEQEHTERMFAVVFEGDENEVLMKQSELLGLVSKALLDLAWQHPTQAFSSIAKVQRSTAWCALV